jgi:hypothetical protein
VISFFGLFVMFLLIFRIKPSFKFNSLHHQEKNDHEDAAFIVKSMKDTVARQTLEQLKDEAYRKKAWAIYHSEKQVNEQIILLNEENTLRHLEKRIDYINKLAHNRIGDKTSVRRKQLKSSSQTRLHIRHMSLPSAQSSQSIAKINTKKTKDNNTELTSKSLKDWAKKFQIKLGLDNTDDVFESDSNIQSPSDLHITKKDENRQTELVIASYSGQTKRSRRRKSNSICERNYSINFVPLKNERKFVFDLGSSFFTGFTTKNKRTVSKDRNNPVRSSNANINLITLKCSSSNQIDLSSKLTQTLPINPCIPDKSSKSVSFNENTKVECLSSDESCSDSLEAKRNRLFKV